MKTKFNNFINENLDIPERDFKYKYLLDVCEKCNYETTNMFFVKNLIEIGTCGKHKIYLNYLDNNHYDKRLSFWIVYNEKPDDLYGTDWDFGVIYEENGKLKYNFDKHQEIILYPDFIDRIYDEIKSYSDLDKWCEHIKYIGKTSRKYSRWAVQNKKDKKLTWDERIEWIKVKIEIDKLLNRHKTPYEQKTLDEMLKLGEIEYTKIDNERNERMNKIMNEIDFKK